MGLFTRLLFVVMDTPANYYTRPLYTYTRAQDYLPAPPAPKSMHYIREKLFFFWDRGGVGRKVVGGNRYTAPSPTDS